MTEARETNPTPKTVESPKPSQKNSLKKRLASLGFAVGTAVASLVATPPQEANAQREAAVQPIKNEQSPEFLVQEVSNKLKQGNQVTVVDGTILISSDAGITDHLTPAGLLSEEAPFVQPKTSIEIREVKEIINPMVLNHKGNDFLVWFAPTESGELKPVAVPLKPENFGQIMRSEDHQPFEKNIGLMATKLKAEGRAEANFNGFVEPTMMGKDPSGKLHPMMLEKRPKPSVSQASSR